MTQTTISNEQLTVFMATTQLLANYSCLKKEPKNAVGTYCGSTEAIFTLIEMLSALNTLVVYQSSSSSL